MSIVEPQAPPIEYPSGDGQPMAETWLHVQAIMLLHQALEDFFHGRSDVLVASDLFWYWEEGNTTARVAPDVMAVPGVRPRDPREWRSFFSWEENVVPAVVFEMASAGTWREDLDDKYDRYEQLGVREYFLFDPEGAHLMPRLQGYRLNGTVYRRIRQSELVSELGFGLRAEGEILRLTDPRTGHLLPNRRERAEAEEQRANAEGERANAERERANTLQAEVERLRALLERRETPGGGGS